MTGHPVPVTIHRSPLRVDVGEIADTVENREWLETQAIPKCQEWREANPEYRFEVDGRWLPILNATMFTPENLYPAPYCCSAYCARCAGLRALNRDDAPLTPNEWMTK